METFAIKQYLHDICGDFSTMLSSGRPERMVVVEGIEINLPAATAIPLGFIASELITNAVKYGTGRITVSLERNSEKKYALAVSNDGPGLPDDFDSTDRKGLGMRIIRSFAKQIGGELRIARAEGARRQDQRTDCARHRHCNPLRRLHCLPHQSGSRARRHT
jgi:two-component sensor histidine kinase